MHHTDNTKHVLVADGQHRGVPLNNPASKEERQYRGWLWRCSYSTNRNSWRSSNTSTHHIERYRQGTGDTTERRSG